MSNKQRGDGSSNRHTDYDDEFEGFEEEEEEVYMACIIRMSVSNVKCS